MTSPLRSQTPDHPNTRETLSWLLLVQYHAPIASTESREILLTLSHTLPKIDFPDPTLTSVIEAIQAFACTKIYDPDLEEKASLAIDRLSKTLSSPIKIASPRRNPATVTYTPRKLFGDD